jgi:hypothetical protein
MRYHVHATYFYVSLSEAQIYIKAHWNSLATRDSPQRRRVQLRHLPHEDLLIGRKFVVKCA